MNREIFKEGGEGDQQDWREPGDTWTCGGGGGGCTNQDGIGEKEG